MEKDKLLEQAVYLIKKLRAQRLKVCSSQDFDLLTQEVDIYLKQFQPLEKPPNKYRQSDIEEQINNILKKDPNY